MVSQLRRNDVDMVQGGLSLEEFDKFAIDAEVEFDDFACVEASFVGPVGPLFVRMSPYLACIRTISSPQGQGGTSSQVGRSFR